MPIRDRIASFDVARTITLPLAGGSDAVAAGEGNTLLIVDDDRNRTGPLLS